MATDTLTGIPADWVERVWPAVAPFIERFIEKTGEHRWNLEDIKKAILERDMQLWAIENEGLISTVIITEIINYPRVRECSVFMVSGSRADDWRDSVQEMVVWAAEQGCHYISTMARPGFAKAMDWDKRQIYTVRAI